MTMTERTLLKRFRAITRGSYETLGLFVHYYRIHIFITSYTKLFFLFLPFEFRFQRFPRKSLIIVLLVQSDERINIVECRTSSSH